MKVLIVDDECLVADFLYNFAKRIGLEAEKAYSAKEALEKFNLYQPQWVFLDVKMPDMNGVELLKKLKEINPNIKAMMITGVNDVSTQKEAMELGAFDYIIKPIDLEQVYRTIKKYIPIE